MVAAEAIRQIEDTLAALPGLGHITVVEQATESGEQYLVAYVVATDQSLSVAAIQDHARSLLPGPLMPTAVMVVDEIPVTSGGAVDLSALPVPEVSGLVPYRPPTTAQQEVLCTLFAEVLGVPRCGLDTDFFSLHGTSVSATLLAGRIREAIGIRVSITDLFKASTVAELDRRLEAAREFGQAGHH